MKEFAHEVREESRRKNSNAPKRFFVLFVTFVGNI
jgi:hypothetical protein